GKDLVISEKNADVKGQTPLTYVSILKVNGKKRDCNFLGWEELSKGADLEFIMTDEPSRE
ncbi:MAG: hypothetical protein K2G18_07580, partial [Bacteroidales bacterium]|nr:hypothetical protein [Bacteroidales bacterium]